MYKTIIFDLDDTLTNDCENVREAFKIVLKYVNEDYTEVKFEYNNENLIRYKLQEY